MSEEKESFEGVDIRGIEWEEIIPDNTYWEAEKEGDELSGVITQIEDGDYGTNYQIQMNGGKTFITPSHKMLQRLLDGNVKIGDQVKITYKGNKPTSKGHPVEIYKAYKKLRQKK